MMMHQPLHPGEHVRDVLIDGAGLSITEAAERLGVTRAALSRLINGHTGISIEMALRLSKLLGTSIDLWVNLQAQYDIWLIDQRKIKMKIQPLAKAAAKQLKEWPESVLTFKGDSEIPAFESTRDELYHVQT